MIIKNIIFHNMWLYSLKGWLTLHVMTVHLFCFVVFRLRNRFYQNLKDKEQTENFIKYEHNKYVAPIPLP